jgi:phosphoribosylanthranilate isomerase
MVKVKICGCTRVDDALAAAEEGADFVGFVFAPSPRRAETAVARDAVRGLPRGTRAVGVFMDQPLDEVRSVLDRTGIGIAQLHGAESPADCAALGVLVIKAFVGLDERALPRLAEYDVYARLLDLPKGDPAAQLDPDLARKAKKHGRLLLAGRLTPDRVGPLVRAVDPWGVDVAGGVESAPGVKDRELVRSFIRAARTPAPKR